MGVWVSLTTHPYTHTLTQRRGGGPTGPPPLRHNMPRGAVCPRVLVPAKHGRMYAAYPRDSHRSLRGCHLVDRDTLHAKGRWHRTTQSITNRLQGLTSAAQF